MRRLRAATYAAHRPVFVQEAQSRVVIRGSVQQHAGSGSQLYAPVKQSEAYAVFPGGAVNPHVPIGFNDFLQAQRGALIFPVVGDYHADETVDNTLIIDADPNDEIVKLRSIIPSTTEEYNAINQRLRELNSSEAGIGVLYTAPTNQVLNGLRYNQSVGPPDQEKFDETFYSQQKNDAAEYFASIAKYHAIRNDGNPYVIPPQTVPEQHLTLEEHRLLSMVGPPIMNHIKPIHEYKNYDTLSDGYTNVVSTYSREIPSFMRQRMLAFPTVSLQSKTFNLNEDLNINEARGGVWSDSEDDEDTIYEITTDQPIAIMGPSAADTEQTALARRLPANITAAQAGHPTVPDVSLPLTEATTVGNSLLLNRSNRTVLPLNPIEQTQVYPIAHSSQLIEAIRAFMPVVKAVLEGYYDLRTTMTYDAVMGNPRTLIDRAQSLYRTFNDAAQRLVADYDQSGYNDNERSMLMQTNHVVISVTDLYNDLLKHLSNSTTDQLEGNVQTATAVVRKHATKIMNVIERYTLAETNQTDMEGVTTTSTAVKRRLNEPLEHTAIGPQVSGAKNSRIVEQPITLATSTPGVLVDPSAPPIPNDTELLSQSRALVVPDLPIVNNTPPPLPDYQAEIQSINTQFGTLQSRRNELENELAIENEALQDALTSDDRRAIEYKIDQTERALAIVTSDENVLLTRGETIRDMQNDVEMTPVNPIQYAPISSQVPATNMALIQQNQQTSHTLNQLIQQTDARHQLMQTNHNLIQQIDNTTIDNTNSNNTLIDQSTVNQIYQPTQIVNNTGVDPTEIGNALQYIQNSNENMTSQLMRHVVELRNSQVSNPSMTDSITQQIAQPLEHITSLLEQFNANQPNSTPSGPNLSQPLMQALQTVPVDIGRLTAAINSNTAAVTTITQQAQTNPASGPEIIRDWLARSPIISSDLLDKLTGMIAKMTPPSKPTDPFRMPPILGSRGPIGPSSIDSPSMKKRRQNRIQGLITNAPYSVTVTEQDFAIKEKPRKLIQKKIQHLNSSDLL